MTYMLGVDTGGTYTDAALIKGDQVVATAKALTTRQDLAIGVEGAVRAVLAQSGVSPSEVSLASLSTTLATNALVEGQGGRVALVYVGFAEADLERHGLAEALNGDPVLVMAGGHSHSGQEAAPLDVAALNRFLETKISGVTGFAVASVFATRNPAHELAVAERIKAATGLPVTCSHELSARLNGPKRAVTAVLNARLIGMIDALITRAETRLSELGIAAPMMVVRGDGALMSAEQARQRPIETILSGPAASIVGAHWLTGARDALVSDIGGTTTDVALIRAGLPQIAPEGAEVGGFKTMVEAVAMRTTGLGGDSEVHLQTEGLRGGVRLGPRRVLPVALLAHEAPVVVHEALDRQLAQPVPGEYDGRFVRSLRRFEAAEILDLGLSQRDAQVLGRITQEPQPMGAVLRTRLEQSALNRLWERGLVQIGAVTPSDACHMLGLTDAWDAAASQKALDLMARRRVGSGNRVAADASALAQMIKEQMTEQTSLALLEAVFAEEALDGPETPAQLARHVLVQLGLRGHSGLLRLEAGVNVDVIGLGASARSYYPPVGAGLNTGMILPDHGDVANAIGAVVGQITHRRAGVVTAPSEGRFRVHLCGGPQDFNDSQAALVALETELRAEAEAAARAAGAEGVQLQVSRDVKTATIEDREVFVEAEITVAASGRPRTAAG